MAIVVFFRFRGLCVEEGEDDGQNLLFLGVISFPTLSSGRELINSCLKVCCSDGVIFTDSEDGRVIRESG